MMSRFVVKKYSKTKAEHKLTPILKLKTQTIFFLLQNIYRKRKNTSGLMFRNHQEFYRVFQVNQLFNIHWGKGFGKIIEFFYLKY